MKTYDVVIIGAGLAGLQCAKLLSQNNVKVLLVDRKTDLTKGIHTTGIFVRKTFEDFEFPANVLGKPVRRVALYSPKLKALNLTSERDEFRVGKMGLLYDEFLQECAANGVSFARSTAYKGFEITGGETIVRLEKRGENSVIKTKVLVGADGAQSRVAKDLKLDENRQFIVGAEEVWKDVRLEGEPLLNCFLDAEIAPGYLAWITNDGEEVHIGVGGEAENFNSREALEKFKKRTAEKFVDLENAQLVEKRGGKIPVGGILKKIANRRGLLVGDAAGAVSPLTAGGLDACMRLSKFAAETISERLKTDDPKVLLNYSGEIFRARFVSRIWMRKVLTKFSRQFLLETGCALLRLPFIKKIAEHIFFGRGSFPDAETRYPKSKVVTDS